MSFIPLGFAFAAQNKGLDEEFKKTRKSMGGINADLDAMTRASGKSRDAFFTMGATARTVGRGMTAPFRAMGKLMDGLKGRVDSFNLASIAGDMKALTGEAGNLSDEMDSAFASNAKAVKPLLAGIGKSGKELRKLTGQASGMAYSMGVSAETVGKVMVELESAGGPAKKGLDALNMSVSDFVKFSEVSGIETAKLGSIMGDMQTSWNMTDKQARATADAVLGYGQAAGIGTEGLKGLDGLMEKFNATLADAPPEMQVTAEQMQGMVIGATKLAGAYREMGASQEQAMEYSTQTAELFTKEAVAFQKAAEGRGEYGDMAKSLMPVLKQWGSWEEFGAALKVGALDSTKGMVQLNKIVQEASNKGFGPADVLMRQLLGTIQETSPSMAWLAQNTNAGQAALAKFDAMSIQTDGSIKKLGKDGFSTGFTLQESFEMARKGMEHAVRGVAGKEVQGMVKTQMAAYHDTGKEIVKMGSDKTWGPLLKKAVILKRMGVRGLFMSGAKTKADQKAMAGTFAKMELAAGTIEDITGAASPLMNVLGKFGTLGTVVGGIATWFSMDQKTRDDIWNSVKPLVKMIKDKLHDIWFGTEVGRDGELMGGLKDKLWDFAKNLWDNVVKGCKTYGPTIFSALWDGIKGIGAILMKGIGTAFEDPKIGLGASMLVAIKAGGIFGAKGALASMAVGSWVAAYNASEAALKQLKDKNADEADMQRRNREALAKQMANRLLGPNGQPVSDANASTFNAGRQGAQWRQGKTGQTKDYAQQFATDEATQLALVEANAVGMRDKMGSMPFGMGEMTADWIEAAQRQAVKKSTQKDKGNITDITGMEGVASMFMPGVGEATTKQMQGYQGRIGAVQQTQGGQSLLAQQQGLGAPSYANAINAIPQMMQDVSNRVTKISGNMGVGMMTELSKGIADNQQSVYDDITAMEMGVRDMTEFHSPPKAGPLSDAAGNPLYNGGVGMMNLIADGIDTGAIAVQDAMAEALTSSYAYAMGKYTEAVKADLSVKGVMAQVADQIVANLTGVGRINMGDVHITPEEQKVIQASLDVPGMAGLAGAVVADGNLTRKILTRIADATEGTFKLLNGDTVNKAGRGGGVVLAGA